MHMLLQTSRDSGSWGMHKTLPSSSGTRCPLLFTTSLSWLRWLLSVRPVATCSASCTGLVQRLQVGDSCASLFLPYTCTSEFHFKCTNRVLCLQSHSWFGTWPGSWAAATQLFTANSFSPTSKPLLCPECLLLPYGTLLQKPSNPRLQLEVSDDSEFFWNLFFSVNSRTVNIWKFYHIWHSFFKSKATGSSLPYKGVWFVIIKFSVEWAGVGSWGLLCPQHTDIQENTVYSFSPFYEIWL